MDGTGEVDVMRRKARPASKGVTVEGSVLRLVDSTALAQPPKGHVDALEGEPVTLRTIEQQLRRIEVYVAYVTAPLAQQVVMFRGVWIKTQRTSAEFDRLDLSKAAKVVEYLVHGFQRNHRHDFEGRRMHSFRRWVRYVAMQQSKDKLTLGGDFQPPLSEERPQFLGDCNVTLVANQQLLLTKRRC